MYFVHIHCSCLLYKGQVHYSYSPHLLTIVNKKKVAKMIKLRSKRFSRSSSKLSGGGGGGAANDGGGTSGEIKWELRPGGMLVQKRECKENTDEIITIKVSTVSYWHDISIQATSTFGKYLFIFCFSKHHHFIHNWVLHPFNHLNVFNQFLSYFISFSHQNWVKYSFKLKVI